MDELIGLLFGFAIYVLPLIGATYALSRTLLRQISDLRNEGTKEAGKLNPYLKIGFTVVGILYGTSLLFFVALIALKPGRLPFWLFVLILVLFVPYLACVFALVYGLGELGHSGVSPSKIVNKVFTDIKGSYNSSSKDNKKHNKRMNQSE